MDEKQELLDCIHNLMGCFDTPIARRYIDNDIANEAREIGRVIMTKHGRANSIQGDGMSAQQIKVQLKDLIKSDSAIAKLGLNPWCVNEGADGDTWYVVDVSDAVKWGVLRCEVGHC